MKMVKMFWRVKMVFVVKMVKMFVGLRRLRCLEG